MRNIDQTMSEKAQIFCKKSYANLFFSNKLYLYILASLLQKNGHYGSRITKEADRPNLHYLNNF